MALTLATDPIMEIDDALRFLDIKDDQIAIMVINSLTKKFMRFTGRVQLSASATAIVEYLRAAIPQTLYLHCSPVTAPATNDIVVDIWDGHEVISTFKYSEQEVVAITDAYEARLETQGQFPVHGEAYMARVTYKAGWTDIPGDVTEGAILQGRVDLKRLEGEVGVTRRSSGDESTDFDTRGIIRTVQELWSPYRIID